MSAESKQLTGESPADGDEGSRDPFAVDVFASPSSAAETSSGGLTTPRGFGLASPPPSWTSRLPRVTFDELQASEALAGLPVEAYAQIAGSVVGVLSQYSITPAEKISISLIDLNEIDFSLKAPASDGPPGVFATFTTRLGTTSFSFQLEAPFAVSLVDRMLGGDGAPPDSLRTVTKTEQAVIEFLCLSSASELNKQGGEPLLNLQTIGDQPPWRTSRLHDIAIPTSTIPVWRRGLVAAFRIALGEITGIVRVYLDAGSLPALHEINRRLQGAHEVAGNTPNVDRAQARYERVAPELRMTVLIGETYVTVPELAELESGDVMVVEKPSVRWREQRVVGSLLLRVGDSDATLITGELSDLGVPKQPADILAEAGQNEAASTGSLTIKVGEIVIAPLPRFPERLKMEEEDVETPAEGANLIEAVMLTVRVELAARRLRLDELSRLRANQILDLQCLATDPVDLVVDGRKIASGELVDIEGRLGVQITQVLV